MEVPMLDDAEFSIAQNLYSQGFKRKGSIDDRFKPLLEYYNQLTSFEETNPYAIMHHQISLYGTICDNCGKPYRTPQATYCAACGHKKT